MGGPQTDLRKNTFCVNTVSTRFLSKQAPASRELSCAWDFGGLCNAVTAINTPFIRHVALKFMHAPLISLSAGQWFTDTTNAYRAYSRHYLEHPEVQPFRDIFQTYELLAYLSVRASQLGLKACEIPVTRAYPPKGKVPTKISFFKGNFNLFATLVKNLFRKYHP